MKHRDEIVIDFFDGNFDVIILSETWLHAAISDSLVNIPGYRMIRSDRLYTNSKGGFKTGGGICLYIKESPGAITEVRSIISNSEIELVRVTIGRPIMKVTDLVAVYRPPLGNVQSALDAITNELDDCCVGNERLIMGDFNLDIGKQSCNGVKKLDNLMRSRSLSSTITHLLM